MESRRSRGDISVRCNRTASEARSAKETIWSFCEVTCDLSRVLAPGKHQLQWTGTNYSGLDVTSGIYIVQLTVGNWSESRKVVVLR